MQPEESAFNSFKKISSEKFVRDVLQRNPPSSTLIVDCRSPEEFQNERISNSVNSPLVVAELPSTSTTIVSISSKTKAVRVLLELCPNLLMHLRQPGFFTDIVVYYHGDNYMPKPVHNLMKALSKWTGEFNQKTNIWFLRDGYFEFSWRYPEWTCNMENTEPSLFWTTPEGFTKLVQCQIKRTCSCRLNPEERAQQNDSLDGHVRSLQSAIEATTAVVGDLKLNQRSLEEIQSSIIDEIDKKIDAVVPSEVKCPVCYEVFAGGIFLCTNGHCLCSTCCESLTSCPVCRGPYYVPSIATGKIRGIEMENLLTKFAKVDCPDGCGEKLLYSQVADHLQNCVKEKYNDVKSKIQTQLEQKRSEIQVFNEQLKTLTAKKLEYETYRASSGFIGSCCIASERSTPIIIE